MIRVLDSASSLNASADTKAGYGIHARYLRGNFAMTRAEVEAATKAGEGIWSISETAADRALGGASAAHIDALADLASARALGQPRGSLIFATVDFDPNAEQLAAVFSYLNTYVSDLRAQSYKGGVYGGASVVEGMRGKCDGRWQAAGWSYGVTVPGCLLYQTLQQVTVGGVDCDLDEDVNLSQPLYAWNLNGLYPPVKKKPSLAKKLSRIVPSLYDPNHYTLAAWDDVWRNRKAA